MLSLDDRVTFGDRPNFGGSSPTLRPHMTCAVVQVLRGLFSHGGVLSRSTIVFTLILTVQDRDRNTMQMLSSGHPSLVLKKCTEYWDGHSLWPLTFEDKQAITDR